MPPSDSICTRNESWEKEREPKREARGDAEELTEIDAEISATAGNEMEGEGEADRKEESAEGEEPEWSKAKRRPKPIGGAK